MWRCIKAAGSWGYTWKAVWVLAHVLPGEKGSAVAAVPLTTEESTAQPFHPLQLQKVTKHTQKPKLLDWTYWHWPLLKSSGKKLHIIHYFHSKGRLHSSFFNSHFPCFLCTFYLFALIFFSESYTLHSLSFISAVMQSEYLLIKEFILYWANVFGFHNYTKKGGNVIFKTIFFSAISFKFINVWRKPLPLLFFENKLNFTLN